MSNVDAINKLIRNANQIRDLFERKIPMWKREKETYDKTRFGFVAGSSDGWYTDCETTVYFSAWAGTYGSSSVYKQINMDGDIFKKYFMEYLNKNKESIMLDIASKIEQDAIEMRDSATKELEERLNALKNYAP